MTTVTVTAEVDLGEVDTEDLVKELKLRTGGEFDRLQSIHQKLVMGAEKDAVEQMRDFLRDYLGKVL